MHPSNLGAIEWEVETTFCENVSTFATGRIGHLGPLTMTLSQERTYPDRLVQYRGEGTTAVIGPMGGKITTREYMSHGSSCAGAVTQTPSETLLGHTFGVAERAATAGTTFTGGTATAPTTASSATFGAGSAVRAGVLGDGRGNGQFYAISTHPSNTMNLLGAMDAAPTNGDVACAPVMVYENSDPTLSAITGVRMRVLTPNQVFELHGCHCEAVRFVGYNTAGKPIIERDWDIGWWKMVQGVTAISALAAVVDNPAPVAAGSFWIQDVGTTTRDAASRLVIRDFVLTYNLATLREEGPGAVVPFCTKTGARRLHDNTKPQARIEFVVDSPAQSSSPDFDAAFLNGVTRKQAMYTLSPADGSAVAFRWNSLCWAGPRATQFDFNGKNARRWTLDAYTGATLTSDRTRAAQILLLA